MAKFYDTHAHLDFPNFKNDLDTIIQRAAENGIERILSIGVDQASSEAAVELAEKYPSVYAVIGWHPCYVMDAPEDVKADLIRLASHPKVVALGETGIDQHRLPSSEEGKSVEDDMVYLEKQKSIFHQHLEVAKETGLNCVIHQRDAFEIATEILAPFSRDVRGVFHCFVGTPEQQSIIQEMGSMVSFTGIVTFKNANEVRETLSKTPLDQWMLETDCPYLAPVPYRGKRAEPAYVRNIAEFLADFLNVPLDKLSEQTCANAESFFRF